VGGIVETVPTEAKDQVLMLINQGGMDTYWAKAIVYDPEFQSKSQPDKEIAIRLAITYAVEKKNEPATLGTDGQDNEDNDSESTVLELGQGEVLGDPTVQDEVCTSQEQRAMIRAAMSDGFTFEQGIALLENKQKVLGDEQKAKNDKIESTARAEASKLQGYSKMSVAQINAISRQKFLDAHPEVAMQVFGQKPADDGQQNPPRALSQRPPESAVEHPSKRKRYESFIVWIRNNTGLTYGPNLAKGSTPIAVQALASFVDSTALFAFNKLAYTLQDDPRLKKYDIHRRGHARTFEEGMDRLTCTSMPLDEDVLRCLVKLAHDAPASTAMPPALALCNPPLDWDNLDPSVVRESVVSRLGIEGDVARTTANANALLLLSYAHSLCLHKTEDGVVTIEEANWSKLEDLHAYTDMVRSAAVQDSDAFRLKVSAILPFRTPAAYDAEHFIDYAFAFGVRLNRQQANTINGREVWMRAVGKNLKKDYMRLCSFSEVEQTLWQREEFFSMDVFAGVLSDFVGNVSKSRMVAIADTVRNIIRNKWVPFDLVHICNPSGYYQNWQFSTLAFQTISRVFALVLIVKNLPASRISIIENNTRNFPCAVRA
jgi:hypothetical protein